MFFPFETSTIPSLTPTSKPSSLDLTLNDVPKTLTSPSLVVIIKGKSPFFTSKNPSPSKISFLSLLKLRLYFIELNALRVDDDPSGSVIRL